VTAELVGENRDHFGFHVRARHAASAPFARHELSAAIE